MSGAPEQGGSGTIHGAEMTAEQAQAGFASRAFTSEALARAFLDDIIHETTVSEINIAGLPASTGPAGRYASGAPYNLIVVGPMWSEAALIGIAYAYEQATRHRKPPMLSQP